MVARASRRGAVIDGLEADVVTLALAYDIDAIAEARSDRRPTGRSACRTTRRRTPRPSYSSCARAIPKASRIGATSSKPGVEVITPNPKTSGGARWNYLAAWGYALKQPGGNDAKAKEFVAALFKNVPVLDTGARGSTTTFVQRGIGDVLLAWENEALLARQELGKDKFEIIAPSLSILAEPPVAVVDKVADKHGTRAIAEAYLKFLYTSAAQDIAGKHYYRPYDEAAAKKYAAVPQGHDVHDRRSIRWLEKRRPRTSPTAACSISSESESNSWRVAYCPVSV